MRKQCSLIIGTVLVIGGVISGFKKYETLRLEQYKLISDKCLTYDLPSLHANENGGDWIKVPFTGKTYVGFKQAIGIRESYGLYDIVNPYGYMGKYQFGKTALKAIGVIDTKEFLRDPLLQEKAFDALLAKNKWILKDEIQKFVGKTIAGISITESGILAAAHLGGAGSVKKFLYSGGQSRFRDGFGTSIGTYLKKFGGFDTSKIEAKQNPVVLL
ncbi:peptidoglycan-binding protein LysM [Myroides indicus]|uniref:Peptidoglycan-binding protein LysM n=1 Tax=Myroides indicus TaxID=1323422 RepID=A0A4R7ES87_9FLAO|nr:peptidoglycan-binding protein LysM [Myroides indicus]TDS54600.1 hypothetical protein C8P70_12543 [Myroides indicus]